MERGTCPRSNDSNENASATLTATMKLKDLLILPIAAALIGCGPAAKPTPEPAATMAEEKAAQPADTAAQPNAASGAAKTQAQGTPMTGSATDSSLGGFDPPHKDSGTPADPQQLLQAAVEDYGRMRDASSVEPNQKKWPELTSLEDLVEHRMIKQVPEGPDGRKWSLNTEKMTVVLK